MRYVILAIILVGLACLTIPLIWLRIPRSRREEEPPDGDRRSDGGA